MMNTSAAVATGVVCLISAPPEKCIDVFSSFQSAAVFGREAIKGSLKTRKNNTNELLRENRKK